jgi:cephalosporin hydroxylase
VAKVVAEIPTNARVMVVLDSDHTYAHVLSELRTYGPIVTKGCYLVVADTLLGRLPEGKAPQKRARICDVGDEPLAALTDYLAENDRFDIDEALNGKLVLSSSPGGYCRCVK